ncbi:hypothetical protein L195_g051466, partial [Trifolium pratense]
VLCPIHGRTGRTGRSGSYNIDTYTILVDALCENGRLKDALELTLVACVKANQFCALHMLE